MVIVQIATKLVIELVPFVSTFFATTFIVGKAVIPKVKPDISLELRTALAMVAGGVVTIATMSPIIF